MNIANSPPKKIIVAIIALFLNMIGFTAIAQDFTPNPNTRFAELALKCVHSEYPNKIGHVLASDADVRPPRELTPSFYGCYDWHSSVHGHWLLARYTHLYPNAALATEAKTALKTSLTSEKIAQEVIYINGAGRASFQRPYGLSWVLQLGTELRQWGQIDAEARQLSQNLAPLEAVASAKLKAWLPKLRYPVRVGEHSQTAFGLGLALDWARAANDVELETLIIARSRDYYLGDKNCPINYEPSGEDFLSPCLGEASLMARVLPQNEFATWLRAFLPTIPNEPRGPVVVSGYSRSDPRASNVLYGIAWLPVGVVTDRSDPKLAHIDGLNLSRAWMLKRVLQSLPLNDRRRLAITNTMRVHKDAALPFVTGEHYEGGHWLGTYAMYLQSDAGLLAQ